MRAPLVGGLVLAALLGAVARGGGYNPGSSAAAVPTMASTGFSAFTDPQGTASLSDSPSGIVLGDAGEGGTNIARLVCKSAPSTPYTAIGKIAMNINVGVGAATDNWGGLAWRKSGASGSAPIIMSGLVEWGPGAGTQGVFANNFTNFNTFAGTVTMSTGINWSPFGIYFGLKDDGTNVTFSYGPDAATLKPAFSTTKAAGFLGAGNYNDICLMINAKGQDTTIVLEYYKETSP
jgi:hypothetical protein